MNKIKEHSLNLNPNSAQRLNRLPMHLNLCIEVDFHVINDITPDEALSYYNQTLTCYFLHCVYTYKSHDDYCFPYDNISFYLLSTEVINAVN